MYKLYFWNPWDFGKWIYKGEFKTKKELYGQIKNKSETTYKITKDDEIVEFHKARSHCWKYGMIEPKLKTSIK